MKVKTFGNAAKYSITIAFAATGIALLLGLPAAYALNRYRFRGKEFIKGLFLSPVLIPVIDWPYHPVNPLCDAGGDV